MSSVVKGCLDLSPLPLIGIDFFLPPPESFEPSAIGSKVSTAALLFRDFVFYSSWCSNLILSPGRESPLCEPVMLARSRATGLSLPFP